MNRNRLLFPKRAKDVFLSKSREIMAFSGHGFSEIVIKMTLY